MKEKLDFNELDRFISENIKNELLLGSRRWISISDIIDLYIRVTQMYVSNKREQFLVIANVSIKDHDQNKGYFTDLLNHLEANYTTPIYVECIHNGKLITFLEKRGYAKIKDSFPTSMVLMR